MSYVPSWFDASDLGERFDSREAIAWAEQWDAMNDEERREEYGDGVAAASELRAAIEDASQAGAEDWEYGEQFIRDDVFTEYAQELAEDCGMVSDDAAWPVRHIDWEAAANELRQDYSVVTLAGTDYLFRA